MTYLTVLGIIWLFSACHDVTVGYLFIGEAAGYSKDTLHIVNIEIELQKLKHIQTEFNSISQEIQNKIDEAYASMDEIYDSGYWEAMDEALLEEEEKDPSFWNDWNNYERFMEKFNKEWGITDLENTIEAATEELENLGQEMGIESVAILKKNIADYENRINFKIAWSSPKIEGVQGTEPMVYTVIGVKGPSPEAAEKFMSNVRILGAGMINVDYNIDVPIGAYTLTLEVSNEGRTRILEDVFTFVIDPVGE